MQNKNADIATSIGHDSYFWLGGSLLGAWGHRNAIELDPWTLYTLGPVAMWKSTLCIREFLKTYSRPLVHIMGPWPLGTHASCVKNSEGRFFIFRRFD